VGPLLVHHHRSLPSGARRTLIPLPFEVSRGTEALTVTLDYRPRRSRDAARNNALIDAAVDRQLHAAQQDGVALPPGSRAAQRKSPGLRALELELRSLLNLVLFDPAGCCRGRWDHNELDEAPAPPDVVCAGWASPGYVAGPLEPGRWIAVLEVHEIVTEQCRFELSIHGLDHAPPAPRQDPTRRAWDPAAREYPLPPRPGWFRGELHCHSTASDGLYAPAELLERAAAAGLDFIALTDHNTLAGLSELGSDPPLPVIPGCEITTFHGHLLALGIAEAPTWYLPDQGRLVDPTDLARQVRAQGGLFGLAHPHVLGNPICSGCRADAPVDGADLDLLEVWSRGAEDRVANLHALARLDALQRAGQPVVAVAGRDWHGPGQEAAGAGGRRFPATVVRAASADPRALLEGIRRGDCYMAVGAIVLELSVADGAICAQLEGLEEPASLRLLAGGEVIRQERLSAGGTVRLQHAAPDEPVRLELWGADGAPLCLSNFIGRRA
jgi:PHP domain